VPDTFLMADSVNTIASLLAKGPRGGTQGML
jgi:hypothetical protein